MRHIHLANRLVSCCRPREATTCCLLHLNYRGATTTHHTTPRTTLQAISATPRTIAILSTTMCVTSHTSHTLSNSCTIHCTSTEACFLPRTAHDPQCTSMYPHANFECQFPRLPQSSFQQWNGNNRRRHQARRCPARNLLSVVAGMETEACCYIIYTHTLGTTTNCYFWHYKLLQFITRNTQTRRY